MHHDDRNVNSILGTMRPVLLFTFSHLGAHDTHDIMIRILFEFFQIEFYRIYRIYRICRKLFLVVLKKKITKNSLIQNL